MKSFRGRDFISGVLVGSLLLSGITYASSNIKLIVDGKEIQADIPPQIINGRTMVPARFLAESLGATVSWDAASGSVIVTSKEKHAIDIPGNVNPVFVFFKYLFVDPSLAEQQFQKDSDGKNLIQQLTRNIKSVQYQDLHEVANRNGQVEFSATFLVERGNGYNGPLNEGENRLSFLVEKEGDMIFKIVSYGTGSHLLDNENSPTADISSFTAQDAVQLAAAAHGHYWVSMSGGTLPGETEVHEFSIQGKGDHYRWMGLDLDTKEEYFSYLGEVFTPEMVKQFWDEQVENGFLVEVNGRLAQPNADGGSLVSWSEANAKLIEEKEDIKTFHFDVPVGDMGSSPYEITVRYVEGIGWRLDEMVEAIR